MKYLWQEIYRCGCTSTERVRDRLPGFCPEHDAPRQHREQIKMPTDFKLADLGLHAAKVAAPAELCRLHQANALTCPYCEVLERNP